MHENEVIPPYSLIIQDFHRKTYHTYKTYFNLWKPEKGQQHNRHETTTVIQLLYNCYTIVIQLLYNCYTIVIQSQSQKLKELAEPGKKLK